MSELVLYDLPSREPCRSWSANTLKARTVLNYKKIPFRTQWIPYVRLQETLAATGVAPHPKPNWADYTTPTVRFPDGTVIMDSEKIIPKIEELYPSPSLHLDRTDIIDAEKAAVGKIFPPLMSWFFPKVASRILVEEDLPWFEDDRGRRFGMSMNDLEQSKSEEDCFAEAQPGFEMLEKVLTDFKKDDGPFVMGKEICYADFLLVGLVRNMEMLGERERDLFVGRVKGLKELYEAGRKYALIEGVEK
ncbi:hypothetical protein CERZMDRAFT_34473 [Cercospora zeae-maydis SCOH1-5]|uniref:GST N-terminal domain-containing protein n=1 Tax=Cercospora zeae-maydis SCOH1-5 TaxID=717836 RepID=A0A6A6FRL9_9PEZI|nr:hypothetical protein CERZMDRAFT_34473 [Cercospora zeae-maydis SCOH1-5]